MVNVTNHSFFLLHPDGTTEELKPCGVVLNAEPVEESVEFPNGKCALVNLKGWAPTEESNRAFRSLLLQYPNAIFLGSMIAALAWPGKVYMAIAVPEDKRGEGSRKRVYYNRFSSF